MHSRLRQKVLPASAVTAQHPSQEGAVDHQHLFGAGALRQAWHEVLAIQLFCSILDERFCDHSDLVLLVEGLPASDLLDALAQADVKQPDR